MNWRDKIRKELPLLGHRNWIVVADSAYPAQSRSGIETIVTGAEQLKVVTPVLAALDKARHVRPIVYVDSELQHVPEEHARGIGAYREKLAKLLAGRPVISILHEEIIAKLDQAGAMFR